MMIGCPYEVSETVRLNGNGVYEMNDNEALSINDDKIVQ